MSHSLPMVITLERRPKTHLTVMVRRAITPTSNKDHSRSQTVTHHPLAHGRDSESPTEPKRHIKN